MILPGPFIPDLPKAKKAVAAQPIAKKGAYVPFGAYRKDGTAVSPATVMKAWETNKNVVPKSSKPPKPPKEFNQNSSNQPNPPKKDLGTGSIETQTAGDSESSEKKSLREQLGIQEELDIQQYENAYDSAKVLRDFQEKVARRQLDEAFSQIDRAAIEGYKDIANDYAARGMARSGGKMAMESRATALKNDAIDQAQQTLDDLLEQLADADTADKAALNTAKQKIMADYILRRIQSGLGG